MDQGLAAIASAFIGGIFVIVGAVISKSSSSSLSAFPGGVPLAPGIGVPTTASTLSFGRILIHVGVIQFVLQTLALIVGLIAGAVIASSNPNIDIDTLTNILVLIALIAGSLGLIIAFTISGAKVLKAYRWQHLFYVALGVITTSLFINYLLLAALGVEVQFQFQDFLLAVTQGFVCMAIGGAIANITSS